MPRTSVLRAVVLDLGETILDETRSWGRVADQLGVPRFTFFAVVGGLIARGEHHRRVFELVGRTTEEGLARLGESAGSLTPEDLYPDVLPCMEELKNDGYILAVAGNFAASYEDAVRHLRLPIDLVLSSESLGAEKPSQTFFSRVAERMGMRPSEIAYVGDRVDNDIVPSSSAGMAAVLVRRGPWAILHGEAPAVPASPVLVVDSLADVPAELRRIR